MKKSIYLTDQSPSQLLEVYSTLLSYTGDLEDSYEEEDYDEPTYLPLLRGLLEYLRAEYIDEEDLLEEEDSLDEEEDELGGLYVGEEEDLDSDYD